MNTTNHRSRPSSERGNIFTILFISVAVVGIITASTMNLISGPIRTASRVNALNMATASMQAAGRILIIDAANQANSGDVDSDGTIEPRAFTTVSSGGITGGGSIPLAVGANGTDPWGKLYGYCVWNNGTAYGALTNILAGAVTTGSPVPTVIAVISAGPDKIFQTSCAAYASGATTGDTTTTGVIKVSGSDDITMKWSYAEALAASSGLWSIKAGTPTTATINKNLEVTDPANSNAITAKIDRTTGIGDFLGITTNSIVAKTSNIGMTGTFKYASGSSQEFYNTADQVTNYERIRQFWSGNDFYIGADNGGTGLTRVIRLGTAGQNIAISPNSNLLTATVNTNAGAPYSFTGTASGTSGIQYWLSITPTVSQSGTAGYTGLRVNATESATGSGQKLLADFQVGGSSKVMITNAGYIGVGKTPSYSLDTAGDIRANTTVYTSDIRLKKDVRTLDNALELVTKLRGVHFQWKKPNTESQKGLQTGLIAQEVEKIYPELVMTDNDGFKAVNYAALVAPLIEAVKDLKKMVDDIVGKLNPLIDRVTQLEKENVDLKLQLKDMDNRLDTLEGHKP